MIFINKMDRPWCGFDRAIETISDRLWGAGSSGGGSLRRRFYTIEREAYDFGGEKGEHVTVRPLTETEAEIVAEYRETLLLRWQISTTTSPSWF